jgi:ankyrin repeat protein
MTSTDVCAPASPKNLFCACYNAGWERALAIIRAGVPASHTDAKTGASTLHVAVFKHAPMGVLQALLDDHANVNATDKHGATVLHYACQIGSDSQVLQLLLDRGADVNARMEMGPTPLNVAIQYGAAPAAVKLLLERGANPGLADKNGWSALLLATDSESYPLPNHEIVKLLLDHGAEPDVRLPSGHSPHMLAEENGASAQTLLVLKPPSVLPSVPHVASNTSAKTLWQESPFEPLASALRSLAGLSVRVSRASGSDGEHGPQG